MGAGRPKLRIWVTISAGEKVKRHAGELRREFATQFANVVRRGVVIFVERHHDIRVAGADQTGGTVHVIDLADGQTDVIEYAAHFGGRDHAPDGVFHQIAEPRGLLDAGAGFGSQVENELAAIRVREEILPEKRHQQERGKEARSATGIKRGAPDQRGKQALVGEAQPFEAALECALEQGKGIA